MHIVMWTIQVPLGQTKADLRQIIRSTAHNYLNISDLVRKYLGIADAWSGLALLKKMMDGGRFSSHSILSASNARLQSRLRPSPVT